MDSSLLNQKIKKTSRCVLCAQSAAVVGRTGSQLGKVSDEVVDPRPMSINRKHSVLLRLYFWTPKMERLATCAE